MVNQFLALSLFVMLLSFFIILNSMSTFEVTKAKPILKSLSLAFSEEQLNPELEASIAEIEQDSLREGSTLDKLSGLFNARIKGVDVQKNRLGTVMRVRMPIEEFSKNIMVSQNGQLSFNDQGPLLPTLVSMLQVEGSIAHRMDIVLNLNDNPARVQNDDPQTLSGNLKAVASYAAVIERAGLPRRMVSAGLGNGPSETVDLYFRKYVPFSPKGL